MIKKTNILIVEDESIIAESIKMTLENLGYKVAGVVSNVMDAIEILNTKSVDLAIVDINIQGEKNGIWLAKNMLQKIPFIYLTAYGDAETVKQAIETKPSSYLLKPFKKINISTSIQLALVNYSKNEIANINTISKPISDVENQFLTKRETVFIKQKDSYIKLVIKDILFIEADKNYVRIQTEYTNFVIRITLKNIVNKLPDYFVRIHRSFIVNINHINKIQMLNLKVGTFIIPLSNAYRKKLLSKIDTELI